MNTGRGTADFFHVLIVHFSYMIREWTGRIYYCLCFYIPLFTSQFVFQTSTSEHPITILRKSRIIDSIINLFSYIYYLLYIEPHSINGSKYLIKTFQQIHNFNVIYNRCTMPRGSQGDCQIHSGIILLTCYIIGSMTLRAIKYIEENKIDKGAINTRN